MKRAIGYNTTGLTTEELFFPFGPTATGKSTLLSAVRRVLGDYATTADFGTFLLRDRRGGANNDIARLAGRRMVIAMEVEEGQQLAKSLVQQITGGDEISARFLYRESFEFIPTFKLWFAANDRPHVRDDNDANWRHILRIPFDRQIPEEERDAQVKSSLTDPVVAGPAILAWIVQGCLDWQRIGLAVPDAVKSITREYRDEMNPITDFVQERCVIEPDARCDNAVLRAAYQAWASGSGIKKPALRKAFNKRLPQIPGVRQEPSGSRYWFGITILSPGTEGD